MNAIQGAVRQQELSSRAVSSRHYQGKVHCERESCGLHPRCSVQASSCLDQDRDKVAAGYIYALHNPPVPTLPRPEYHERARKPDGGAVCRHWRASLFMLRCKQPVAYCNFAKPKVHDALTARGCDMATAQYIQRGTVPIKSKALCKGLVNIVPSLEFQKRCDRSPELYPPR